MFYHHASFPSSQRPHLSLVRAMLCLGRRASLLCRSADAADPLTAPGLDEPRSADPFLVVADGRTVLRLSDAQQLAQLLRQKQTPHQEDHSYDATGGRSSSQSSGVFVCASKYAVTSV
jgi:hypothetical protein